MERPNLDHVRQLLRAKNNEAVKEIEPQIIKFCKYKLSKCIDSIEIKQAFLLTFESLYNGKKKDSTDPLPDYLLGLLDELMSEYGLVKIDDFKSLQTDDVTLYCWKHKGKWHTKPVILNKVIDDAKVEIRYTYHEPMNGFEHTFKANTFKFAIRQLTSPPKENVNTRYTFFFFNS